MVEFSKIKYQVYYKGIVIIMRFVNTKKEILFCPKTSLICGDIFQDFVNLEKIK